MTGLTFEIEDKLNDKLSELKDVLGFSSKADVISYLIEKVQIPKGKPEIQRPKLTFSE